MRRYFPLTYANWQRLKAAWRDYCAARREARRLRYDGRPGEPL